MERFAWPKNLSSSRKHMIKGLFHPQKLIDLVDAHSQAGNNTEQPLSGEHALVNALRLFSNTLSESISAESSEVLKVPTNACVWSELSDEESINSPFQRSLGDDIMMEDPEIEKGEAYSYHIDQGFDDDIDPDVSLSYIGEKIQRVLGHFRKDFEGGITAENLGAKYGGYGSFLSAYERMEDPKLEEEKIQRVLGHFRKDFEGGITAENLGAKYGGYGSFLRGYEKIKYPKLKEGKA